MGGRTYAVRRGDVRSLREGTPGIDSHQFLGALIVRANQARSRCAACKREFEFGELVGTAGEPSARFCASHLGDLVPVERWPRWVQTVKGLPARSTSVDFLDNDEGTASVSPDGSLRTRDGL